MDKGTIVEKNTHSVQEDDVHEHWCVVHTIQGARVACSKASSSDPCLYEAYMPLSRVIGIEGSLTMNCLVLR